MLQMTSYRITLDREGCIGDAICTALCPENWFMDEDGKAAFRKEVIEESEYQCNSEAENSCPTGVIRITAT